MKTFEVNMNVTTLEKEKIVDVLTQILSESDDIVMFCVHTIKDKKGNTVFRQTKEVMEQYTLNEDEEEDKQ